MWQSRYIYIKSQAQFPHISPSVCAVLPRKPGASLRWLFSGLASPLECSHLLMDAVISLGSFTEISQSHLDFWPRSSSGAATAPVFTDSECFINALSSKWKRKKKRLKNLLSINPGSFYKPNIWGQREYTVQRSTGRWLGTVALGESYASYHSPCITNYAKAPRTTICIISSHCKCAAPWHAIKVDTDECI